MIAVECSPRASRQAQTGHALPGLFASVRVEVECFWSFHNGRRVTDVQHAPAGNVSRKGRIRSIAAPLDVRNAAASART